MLPPGTIPPSPLRTAPAAVALVATAALAATLLAVVPAAAAPRVPAPVPAAAGPFGLPPGPWSIGPRAPSLAPLAAARLPRPGRRPTGPEVRLIIPGGKGPVGQLRASVNGRPHRLDLQNGDGIRRDGRRLRVEVDNGDERSEWVVFGSRDLKHVKGSRIGFAADFEWRDVPSDWAIFPFQAHDTDQHGAPSFAFEKGEIGTRSGSRGSGGFQHSWRYERRGDPVVGRRYRVVGYYDYRPHGGAALRAWVQHSDGGPFSGWRRFADARGIKIGYTAGSVRGIYGKGGGYTKSGRLEGYVYGWAFGHETPALVARAAGFAGP